MTPEQLLELSSWFNTQADLPVNIQAIADSLKATLTPVVENTATVVEEDVSAPVTSEEPAAGVSALDVSEE